jgi:hypothetical protein
MNLNSFSFKLGFFRVEKYQRLVSCLSSVNCIAPLKMYIMVPLADIKR